MLIYGPLGHYSLKIPQTLVVPRIEVIIPTDEFGRTYFIVRLLPRLRGELLILVVLNRSLLKKGSRDVALVRPLALRDLYGAEGLLKPWVPHFESYYLL